MRRLGCLIGRHTWERREDGREEYWACAHCDKERDLPDPPDKHYPTVGNEGI